MEKGGGLVWALMKMETDKVTEVVDEQRELFKGIAKEVSPDYAVTWTNTVEFGQVLESMFGITEFPRIVIQAKAGAKKNFIYDGEWDKDKIVRRILFLDNVHRVHERREERENRGARFRFFFQVKKRVLYLEYSWVRATGHNCLRRRCLSL